MKDTCVNFKVNIKSSIFFEMIYKLLAVLIVIPLNYLILQNYIKQTGVTHITNTQIINFLLTPEGIISSALILGVSFIAIFIEMAVLIYMANRARQGQKGSIIEAVINGISIIPKKIGREHIALVFMTGVIGPLTGLGLYNTMTKKLVVPSFIKFALFKSWQGKVLFSVVMLALCMLLVRWVLSLPLFMIEEITLKEAFKKSSTIYKNHKYKLLGWVIFWGILVFCVKVLANLIYLGIGISIIVVFQPFPTLNRVFITIYLLIFIVAKTLFSLSVLPLFISFLVELYYTYKGENSVYRIEQPIEDTEYGRVRQLLQPYDKTFRQVGFTLFILFTGIIALQSLPQYKLDKKIEVTAHRGSSMKAPENSIPAIELAIEEKAHYAEIDVMLTQDNHVVLFHDPNLKRISGSNKCIQEMTLDEVRKVDIGLHFDEAYEGETIPTLEEAIKLAKGRIKLNIELKPVGDQIELAEAVAKIVKTYQMEEQVVVSSLDYAAIQSFKNYVPETKVGYIMSLGFGDFTQLDVDFVAIEYGLLTREFVHTMHTWGKEVHVWTINEPNKVRDVIQLGADNIITDSVEMVSSVVSDMKSKKQRDILTWFYDRVFMLNKYFLEK